MYPCGMPQTTTTTERHTCPRCDGRGTIPAFRHINHGICLLCNGAGTRPGKARTTQRRRPQRAGANEALWAEFAAAHPAEAELIWAGKDNDEALGYAYASVAAFERRDSNPAQALGIVRSYLGR